MAKLSYKPAPRNRDHLFQEATSNAHSFLLEVDGHRIGRFTSVSGLKMQVEVESYIEGGVNGFEHKLPGRVTWENLVFKRGVTVDDNLFNWFNLTVGTGFDKENSVARATCAVTMLSAAGKRLRSWNIIDAFPVRWSGPDFSAEAEEVPVEELEVAHHGFTATTF
jgi:phage tail-like protein